jgi:hypothetical protein
MVNYAVLYGKTPFTLAKDIDVTQEAAQEFIDAYFRGFPRVRAFIDTMLEDARQTGVVRTMFGRRRLVPNLTSRNFQMRAQSEREAVNMPSRAPFDGPETRDDRPPCRTRTRSGCAPDDPTVHDGSVRGAARRSRKRCGAVRATEGAVTPRVPLTVDVARGQLAGCEVLDT